ncbi:hypothetical protein, partial [Paraburkholderia nemoris]|uniref:hypothetical protein n=1 Tax=Paraburkholderia nemoris TaxID=2793076 RepID=UPI001B8BF025
RLFQEIRPNGKGKAWYPHDRVPTAQLFRLVRGLSAFAKCKTWILRFVRSLDMTTRLRADCVTSLCVPVLAIPEGDCLPVFNIR